MTDEVKEELQELIWWVYPPAIYPWRALAAVVVIALTIVFLTYYGGGAVIGAVGGVAIFLILNGFFLPTGYEITEDKIIWRRLFFRRARSWSDFKCYYADKFGVMLSTMNRPSRLDAWRGMSVWFGRENRKEVLEIIKQHVPPYRKPVDHRDLLG
ncbi:hypothetical protein K8R78_08995 [bacterium]|nr:hypothetical protein [bacterium]